jgi:hypothetical protein
MTDTLSPPEAWDEAEMQIDYDREDRDGYRGKTIREKARAGAKTARRMDHGTQSQETRSEGKKAQAVFVRASGEPEDDERIAVSE